MRRSRFFDSFAYRLQGFLRHIRSYIRLRKYGARAISMHNKYKPPVSRLRFCFELFLKEKRRALQSLCFIFDAIKNLSFKIKTSSKYTVMRQSELST